ncbi:MAG TPA: hypothetical protein VI386_05435 [Candidatus Sulfotelmatobacter sp.]
MKDVFGRKFETADGRPPTTYGAQITIFTPNGERKSGIWTGSGGSQ